MQTEPSGSREPLFPSGVRLQCLVQGPGRTGVVAAEESGMSDARPERFRLRSGLNGSHLLELSRRALGEARAGLDRHPRLAAVVATLQVRTIYAAGQAGE